jgi:hypothetical protein
MSRFLDLVNDNPEFPAPVPTPIPEAVVEKPKAKKKTTYRKK